MVQGEPKPPPVEEICAACKYFKYIVNSTDGMCYRYPTLERKCDSDFCGEWTK
jgi:hypothetical protein